MQESLSNKDAGLQSETLLNERPHYGLLSMKKFYFKNNVLTGYLCVTSSHT